MEEKIPKDSDETILNLLPLNVEEGCKVDGQTALTQAPHTTTNKTELGRGGKAY